MSLDEYLRAHRVTVPAFAAQVGATVSGVTKWRRGERFPRPSQLLKIAAATNGLVMANDFAAPSQEESAA